MPCPMPRLQVRSLVRDELVDRAPERERVPDRLIDALGSLTPTKDNEEWAGSFVDVLPRNIYALAVLLIFLRVIQLQPTLPPTP